MVNAGIEEPPVESGCWLSMLREITREAFPDDEPWCLVVGNMTKPAFLQPGVRSPEKASDYNKVIATPDEMDLPVGSKHHDVRDGNMRNATLEHWLFALVSRQTGGGYDGPRLYEVSRMNSGYGNRHGFSLTPSTRWGAHVSRDLRVLARQHHGQSVKDHLLWTRPWDGGKGESIPLHELEPLPLYVEVSRRIRLAGTSGFSGRRATSQSSRVHAKEAKGMTGDPWTIIEAEKSVTVTDGFGYRQIARYLDPEKYVLPPLARPVQEVDGNDGMHLVARAIVRGQGGTDGYHERTIPMGRKATRMLGNTIGQNELYQAIEARLNIIREVQDILSHANKTYLQNGVSKGQTKKEHRDPIAKARQSLEQVIEVDFWIHLQRELDSEDHDGERTAWCYETLIPAAQRILLKFTQSGMCHRQDRYKATTQADGLFQSRIHTSPKLPERRRETT